ncbi:glycosyltransferase family 2 protein [Peredibacter sp. HCB2-198]|uniref:glycosyltransferase family 2 protein n=1 Tax=Peredibacter sp. HCB2-198 TaxID=3383025 RepID=UPI0038B50522
MPSLSIIIISQGSDERLLKCLDALQVPEMQWQLILHIHGKPLTAAVRAKAESLTSSVLILENPEHLNSGKAKNIALNEAEGEWVCFLNEDATLARGYWDILRPLLSESKIEVLGGIDVMASGMSALSRAQGIALSSPFCAGTTFVRHQASGSKLQEGNEEKISQTHIWVRRSVIGNTRFPENYKRGDEVLFLQELKKKGVGMYYQPRLKVYLFRAQRFSEIFRSTFYAGYYRSKIMREKLTPSAGVFWLPAVFVLLHAMILLDLHTFISLARLYLAIVTFVSLALASRAKSTWLFPIVAILHYFIVLIFGVGFLTERLFKDKN